MTFFAEPYNSDALKEFLQNSDEAVIPDENLKRRLSDTKQIINFIHGNPAEWDSRCSFNIKSVGDQFIRKLKQFDVSKKENIEGVYCIAYRFLCEFDLFIGQGKELSFELRNVKNRIDLDTISDNEEASSQIHFASFQMPISILKEMLNTSGMSSFSDFKAKTDEAANLKKQWDTELEAKHSEVNSLKQKLEEYNEGFNFVGLYKGFSELGTQKKTELNSLKKVLVGMGVVVLLPLLVEIGVVGYSLINKITFDTSHLLTLLPTVTLVLILIYFFRVILHNYNSVRAQVIQLELRQTLCQFIQNYVDYSTKMKQQDGVALEKFENLIFSGIIADTEKLPSTFDGVDQLAGLIKAVKGDK